MRAISGRIEPHGAFATITVMATDQFVATLKKHGRRPPAPISVRALIDTGAGCSALDSGIITRLGLIQTGVDQIHTATTGADFEERDVYDACFFLGSQEDEVKAFTVRAVRGELACAGFLAIIGWEILSHCRLICDGPKREYQLEY